MILFIFLMETTQFYKYLFTYYNAHFVVVEIKSILMVYCDVKIIIIYSLSMMRNETLL